MLTQTGLLICTCTCVTDSMLRVAALWCVHIFEGYINH